MSEHDLSSASARSSSRSQRRRRHHRHGDYDGGDEEQGGGDREYASLGGVVGGLATARRRHAHPAPPAPRPPSSHSQDRSHYHSQPTLPPQELRVLRSSSVNSNDEDVHRGGPVRLVPLLSSDDDDDGGYDIEYNGGDGSGERHRYGYQEVDLDLEDAQHARRYHSSGRRGDGDISPGPMDLEERHQAVNTLFGFVPWKGKIMKRGLEERSRHVRELYMTQDELYGERKNELICNIGNVIWAVLAGWWLAAMHMICALIMFATIFGYRYGKLCWMYGEYMLWPFGRRLEREVETSVRERLSSNVLGASATSSDLDYNTRFVVADPESNRSADAMSISLVNTHPNSWKQSPVGSALFYILVYPILVILHTIAAGVSWILIFFIPMSKMHFTVIRNLTVDPLNVTVSKSTQSHLSMIRQVEGCVYTAYNLYYYKYSVFGMNIILFNMLGFVVGALVLGFGTSKDWREKNALVVFGCCLLSVVPLSYYIGKAVASISAQTSFMVGAFLNATFATLIELVLYYFMLQHGNISVVQKTVVGSLLCVQLLLPGLSMTVGGIAKREQRFNRRAAGVSGVLLLLAVFGAFLPTFFYMFYGSTYLECEHCDPITPATNSTLSCQRCMMYERDLNDDHVYAEDARPLMYICAALLPISYIIGLVFTLKTHSHLYKRISDDPDASELGGHGEAEWGMWTCVIILLVATLVYACIAEALSSSLEPALEDLKIPEEFAGLLIIALTPNIAEIVNACQFALQDNITLALEIGNVAGIQVALIEWPVLVLMSHFVLGDNPDKTFVMIISKHDVLILIGIIIINNYVFIDGRSNYFTGSTLLIIYIMVVASYWYIPPSIVPEVSTRILRSVKL